jgi:hypothetical protein
MPPRQLPDRQPAACLSRLICSNSSTLDRLPLTFAPTIPLNHRHSRIGNAEMFSEHRAIQVRDQGSGLPALSA